MYLCIPSAYAATQSDRLKIVASIMEVERWLDALDPQEVEHARVYRLGSENQIRLRYERAIVDVYDGPGAKD